MEAPKAVQQLHRGDPGKSELPGDWTAAMGKEKARLGTEQRLPFPVPPQARHKHEPSSDTDFQQGKKIPEMAQRDSSTALRETPPGF